MIHLVLINVPPMITPKILLEARANKFKSSYKGYEVLKDAEYPVHAELTGRIFVFHRKDAKKEGRIMKTTEVVWRSGDACFLLNLIADEKSHDEYEAKFFKLLGSFEALPKMAEETRLPNDAKPTSKGGPGS
ncbi:MAG: hypothetical protein GX621_06175 [Pirellulaceae bacterium]|nr:hypothetical protein [Pirellulaceae bacterium]